MESRARDTDTAAAEGRVLERLLEVYAAEERLYEAVLAYARQQGEIVARGTPIAEIRRLLARKRECLVQIAELEAEERTIRGEWETAHGEWSAPGRARLLAARAPISALIDEILTCEARNDRDLLAQTKGM